METLRNQHLQVRVSMRGAQMSSLFGLKTNKEYMWEADPAIWGESSPVLFPQVGGLWNGECRIDGRTYCIPKHGFVKQADFECVEHTDTKVSYRIADSEHTREIFPFPFELTVSYELIGNKMKATFLVRNTGKETMPFHIGGHPSVKFGLFKPEENLRGYLGFNKSGAVESAAVGRGGCIGPHRYTLGLDADGLLPVTDECFSNDAIIVDKQQVKAITLFDPERNAVATVESTAPVFLVWSPYGVKASFLCIEPWYGMPDYEDYKGELRDRAYTNLIEAGQTFEGGYTIILPQEN